MDEKFNKATTQRPQGNRVMDAPLVTIDLRSFTKQIRDEKAWKESDRNAITVFKTDGMRIVLIALHKDAEMVKLRRSIVTIAASIIRSPCGRWLVAALNFSSILFYFKSV